jgi:acyl-CoA-binding protein
VGDCLENKPGILSFGNDKKKIEACIALKGMSKEEAMKQYIIAVKPFFNK